MDECLHVFEDLGDEGWKVCVLCSGTMEPNLEPGGYRKFDPDLVGDLVRMVEAGAYDTQAARAAGVHPSTYQRWLTLDKEPYLTFQKRIKEARARARVAAETSVFHTDPKWWLKNGPGRTGEQNWRDDPKSLQLTGANGGPIPVAHAHLHRLQLDDLSIDELDQLEGLLTKAIPAAETKELKK